MKNCRLNLYNYLCYAMMTAPKYQQRLVIVLVNIVTAAFIFLQYHIFDQIVKPLSKGYQLTDTQQFLQVSTLILCLMAFLGLRRLIMIIDNPISNPPHPERGRNHWSGVNVACFLLLLGSVANLLVTSLAVFMAINNGTSHYAVLFLGAYSALVIASPFIDVLVRKNAIQSAATEYLLKCILTVDEPVFSFVSESSMLIMVHRWQLNTSSPSLKLVMDIHASNQIITQARPERKQEYRDSIFNALTATLDANQARWIALSYLLIDDLPNAGRAMQHFPTPPMTYLIPEHQQFFALHCDDEDERFAKLREEAEKVGSTGEPNASLIRFLQAWNITPYYFIDHKNDAVRHHALQYMTSNKPIS